MTLSERAGQPADPSILVDVDALVGAYYDRRPDPANPAQRVAFGTSGHRGSAFNTAFNEGHIVATTEAICRYREAQGTDGPLFIGRDTHALSEPAFRSALEVLAAHGVDVRIDAGDGYTPTPVISHAILVHNRGRQDRLADGIVVTPSHNPPEDGGFKYNPPNGGPADTDVTGWIGNEANGLSGSGWEALERVPFETARRQATPHDFVDAYVGDLDSVIDMDAIRSSGLRLGVDPLGGASVAYWPAIGERYGLDLTVTNERVDPQFAFMTTDWDGRIRMDPSSPHAMARLVELRDRFDVAFGNDTDADRHGIVTPGAGLLNPNHFLSAAVAYLFGGGRDWAEDVAVGKTLVSSGMLDRVTADLGRRLLEVPVGFKWFVDGLLDGSLGFGGEESAGRLVPAPGRQRLDDGQGRDHRLPACRRADREEREGPGRGVSAADRAVRVPRLPAHRCPGDARPEGGPRAPLTGSCDCDRARRRAAHRDPHDRTGERCPDRWAQGDGRARLVCRPSIGDRGRLQDLRGELPGRGPSPAPDRRGAAGGQCRPRRCRSAVRRAGRSRSRGSVRSGPEYLEPEDRDPIDQLQEPLATDDEGMDRVERGDRRRPRAAVDQ